MIDNKYTHTLTEQNKTEQKRASSLLRTQQNILIYIYNFTLTFIFFKVKLNVKPSSKLQKNNISY